MCRSHYQSKIWFDWSTQHCYIKSQTCSTKFKSGKRGDYNTNSNLWKRRQKGMSKNSQLNIMSIQKLFKRKQLMVRLKKKTVREKSYIKYVNVSLAEFTVTSLRGIEVNPKKCRIYNRCYQKLEKNKDRKQGVKNKTGVHPMSKMHLSDKSELKYVVSHLFIYFYKMVQNVRKEKHFTVMSDGKDQCPKTSFALQFSSYTHTQIFLFKSLNAVF